ncbi:MAG: hypothetical protein D6780_05840 [Candidatus Dadabacteria bacterium]|nr:MAG: hypothetical protein D6780_05840 [Candidatus Dadabacteria bacterium]
MNKKTTAKILLTLILITFFSSCASKKGKDNSYQEKTAVAQESAVKTYTFSEDSFDPHSGVVDYIWEEPMVDVVEVPAGLDPEGHYYRPAHREVVEIKQGRWRYYKKNK